MEAAAAAAAAAAAIRVNTAVFSTLGIGWTVCMNEGGVIFIKRKCTFY
jgi:hypothetical protein